MLRYTTRPISDLTGLGQPETSSPFRVSWTDALDLLEREYDQLNGRNLVIEVDVRERDIRNDGMLRADAKAAGPGARIAFESKHGPIVMATDRFVRPPWRRDGMREDWQHNVYAIAKALEALRLVDRYGVTKRGEQYAGWKAIDSAPAALTTEQAIGVLAAVLCSGGTDVRDDLPKAIRRAKALAHPDRNNGARGQWDQVEEAARVLEARGIDA